MGIGNRKSEGDKGSNYSYRLKQLKLLQNISTASGLGASEATLQLVLSAIQDGQDYESKTVIDSNDAVYIEVRIYNPDTQTWEVPKYYAPGDNTPYDIDGPGGPVSPIVYLNNTGVLNSILTELLDQGVTQDNSLLQLQAVNTNTDGLEALLTTIDADTSNLDVALSTIASQATLAAQAADIATIETNIALLNTKFNAFGREPEATSTPFAIDQEAYNALLAIQTAVQNIDSDLGTGGLALETTQEASRLILVAIDTILAQIYTNLQLNTIETINIKNNTDAMVVDLAAIEVLVTAGNALLTSIDGKDFATETSLVKIVPAVGTDAAAHGAAQKGIRALGTDGTNDQQVSVDADGKVNVLVQNPSPIPVSGTVTVNQPVSVDDNGGSLTVDATDLDIRDLAFATDKVDATGSTVALDTPTLLALESVTVQNAGLASAVNIQDGGNSITIDNANLDLALTPATRTHNYAVSNGVGAVSAGSLCGSVLNNGTSAGTWNGNALPAGVSISWSPIGSARDTYGAINFDATGTEFIIEYTT